MPYQNAARKSEPAHLPMGKELDDDEACRQNLELDPAIRVAAFIEKAEVTAYAESAKTKNVLSQSSDLRNKVGFWVRIVTE